jgi:uncharacterized Tic20 family protein
LGDHSFGFWGEQRMQPTEDERVLAALSHASILMNFINLAGVIATALIWTQQREKSRYVSGHALQSLVYQGAVLLIGLFLMLTWGLCMGLALLPALLRPELFRSSPPDAFWLALISLIVPIGFVGLATLYGLYGALQVYRGRPFLYPLAGRLARNVLIPAAALPSPPLAPSLVPMPAVPPVAVEPAAPVAPRAATPPAAETAALPLADAATPAPTEATGAVLAEAAPPPTPPEEAPAPAHEPGEQATPTAPE